MFWRTFSHCRILSEMSRGGTGIVYRAVDVKLDRKANSRKGKMAVVRQLLLLLCCFLLARWSSAAQFSSTADATVFLRVVGRVRVEQDNLRTKLIDEKEVELATGIVFVISSFC